MKRTFSVKSTIYAALMKCDLHRIVKKTDKTNL